MVLPGDMVDDVADISERSKRKQKSKFYRKNPKGQEEIRKILLSK